MEENKPRIVLEFSDRQVWKAAKHILKKNDCVSLWPCFIGQYGIDAGDIAFHIDIDVVEGAKRRIKHLLANGKDDGGWPSWDATGGYLICYSAEWIKDHWVIEAEVYVDPKPSDKNNSHIVELQ